MQSILLLQQLRPLLAVVLRSLQQLTVLLTCGTCLTSSMLTEKLVVQVMIDHEQRVLRLIDWGLAEFYHPAKEYAHVALPCFYQLFCLP